MIFWWWWQQRRSGKYSFLEPPCLNFVGYCGVDSSFGVDSCQPLWPVRLAFAEFVGVVSTAASLLAI